MAKMTLDDLVAQLRGAYADALRAVVLYGSAAGGEHHDKHSDYNVLVIVQSLSLEKFAAAGSVARAWTEGGNRPPLTLTAAEWRSSVDVFAMEHADILARHQVLYGADGYDVFGGLTVKAADLRQQLEYECLGALLRLRNATFAAGADAKHRTEMLAAASSQVLVLFRTLLRLLGETPSSDNEALCRRAAELGGFDAAPFVAVVAHRRGAAILRGAQVAEVLSGYHVGLERFVAYVDALPVT
jgi:hypothetical protein